MVVLNLDVVQCADPADDIVGHGNDAHLQATAKLHIRPCVAQQQHVGGEAADVNDEGAGSVLQHGGLGHHGGVGLGVDEDLPDHQADRGIVEDELDATPLEVVGESGAQLIVLGG
ncbi:hypothetical protein SDC9_211996 [bioreactor metagenome]|uniref:Uncharacterized protein n=1 Tax=bioreactor metagenome TaxID=1076179 RepID=A0A645JKN0_9ZZZZ